MSPIWSILSYILYKDHMGSREFFSPVNHIRNECHATRSNLKHCRQNLNSKIEGLPLYTFMYCPNINE